MSGPGGGQGYGAPRTGTMLWITAAWGLCFLAIRLGLEDAPVLWFAALRALIAAAALLLLCLVQGRDLPRGTAGIVLVLASLWLVLHRPRRRTARGKGTKDSDAADRAGR